MGSELYSSQQQKSTEARGMEEIPVCPAWEQTAGEGQNPPASSELTLTVMLFLSQLSADEPSPSQPT